MKRRARFPGKKVIANCSTTGHTFDTPLGTLQDTVAVKMSEFLWKKEDLACSSHSEKKRRVLVLYTGGTIGMKWTEKGIL